MGEETVVTDIIPISTIRSAIQDPVKRRYDEVYIEAPRKAIELDYAPVIKDEEHSFRITIGSTELNEEDYELDEVSGLVIFNEVNESGLFTALYYNAQLTDNELNECLHQAINQHIPDSDLEEIPESQNPFISWLATAKAFYMLSSKWATEVRIRTDDLDMHEQQVASRYFELGQRMEDKYNEASAGIIDVSTLTRRDVDTGIMYPDPAEVYDNEA